MDIYTGKYNYGVVGVGSIKDPRKLVPYKKAKAMMWRYQPNHDILQIWSYGKKVWVTLKNKCIPIIDAAQISEA